ncbi:MAG: M42 family peptidase [Anaerolineales bacterium]
MSELLPFLKSLISAPGLSGHEESIRKLIEDEWRPLTDELTISRLGSLHGLKRGNRTEPSTPEGEHPPSKPSILLAAHMDAIGLMVTGLVDGFLRVTQIGGLDPRVLPGQLVTVHGRQDLPGIIVIPPASLLPADAQSGPVDLKYMLVDTGVPHGRLVNLVRVGDLISFSQEPMELKDDTLGGHSLDNRASIAALTQCLQELQGRLHFWDTWIVATAQEEETMGGALTSAFQLRPDLAVAVDVTYGKGPGTPDHKGFALGKGPVLGWGPNIHSGLHLAFKQLADQQEIPYNIEPMPRHSGTDAYALQVAAEGIPTMVVSIPLRYMHTPVEVVSVKDIQRTGHLLAEFIARLEPDFLEGLKWDQ